LGFAHYYSANRIFQQSNTSFQFLVLKEHKGIVALTQNGMASAGKTTSKVITSYHNQVVLYTIFFLLLL
jgi:hypothetical protein